MDLTDFSEIWRYPRFFTQGLKLSEEDSRHARQVLRMKSGDKAVLCENRTDYLCEYADGGFTVIASAPNAAEPPVSLTLYQCLPKSGKFDYIVQKAVELGAETIVPVLSKRCVSRPDDKSAAGKHARWNKIAYEAAKQCGRGIIPTVGGIISFEQAVGQIRERGGLGIIFYECGGEKLSGILGGKSGYERVSVLIGSEGGFEESEVALANGKGLVTATLGRRILRVETASVAALAVIMSIIED